MCSLSFVPVDDIFLNATYIIHKQYMLHKYDSDPLLKAIKEIPGLIAIQDLDLHLT
jgi:patatin-like phospholipase/acyl hydrolase